MKPPGISPHVTKPATRRLKTIRILQAPQLISAFRRLQIPQTRTIQTSPQSSPKGRNNGGSNNNNTKRLRELQEAANSLFTNAHSPLPKWDIAQQATALRLFTSGGWKLTSNNRGIEKLYTFKNFDRAFLFMNQVEQKWIRKRNHHPEWTNNYKTVLVRWMTNHVSKKSESEIDTPFLSIIDIQMAQGCDEVAKEVGVKGQSEEVEEDSEEALRDAVQAWTASKKMND